MPRIVTCTDATEADRAGNKGINLMENPVEEFFEFLADDRVEDAFSLLHPDVVFEVQGPADVPVYGRFAGVSGVGEFFEILSSLFSAADLTITKWSVSDDYVFAHGSLRNVVRRTGRTFECECALVCRTREGMIVSYKMFEDTAALQAAYAQ